MEATREIREYRSSWDIRKKSIRDRKRSYKNVLGAFAELRLLLGRDSNNLWEEEEEQDDIQEINILFDQDSFQSIIDDDAENPVSTSLEESLTIIPNNETLISIVDSSV